MRPAPEWDWIRAATLAASVMLLALALGFFGKGRSADADSGDAVIYGKGPAPGWQDWSWTAHEIRSNQFKFEGGPSIQMELAPFKGVYLHHGGLSTAGFTSLIFWVNGGKAMGQEIVVCAVGKDKKFGPQVSVSKALPGKTLLPGKWSLVIMPLDRLKAANTTITGVVFQEALGKPQPPVYIAGIKLIGRKADTPQGFTVVIDTSMDRHPISPYIYGMASASSTYMRELRIGSNRWGGNPNSRYNWEKGNCWNAGSDYEFRNGNYDAKSDSDRLPSGVADGFITQNRAAGVAVVLTIPTLGYVAKDDNPESRSIGVPRDGGLALRAGGEAIKGYNPFDNQRRTSIRSYATKHGSWSYPPDLEDDAVYQDEWVHHLAQKFGTAAENGVKFYAMDNEPDLWHGTHRDVHPTAMGYDDILSKFIEYATAIKIVDSTAMITGPTSWGWTGYLNSSRDLARGGDGHSDKQAHGNMEFIPWFLDQMRRHDQRRGKRTLDVLDIHYYPQGDGIYGGATDPDTNAARLRSTRSLWDPGYADESWVGQAVRLIPRMKEWINRYYPGTKLGITEWNWGADTTMNGALAIAECLGTFARGDVYLANYWTTTPLESPGYFAFKMYRNADGEGHGFGDVSVRGAASHPNEVSCFASVDGRTNAPVAILINKQPSRYAEVSVTIRHLTPLATASLWRYNEANKDHIDPQPDVQATNGSFRFILPNYSITLVRFK